MLFPRNNTLTVWCEIWHDLVFASKSPCGNVSKGRIILIVFISEGRNPFIVLYCIQRVLPPWLDRTWSDICNPATLVNIFYSRLQALLIAQLSEIRFLEISKTQDASKTCGAFVLENHLWLACMLYYFPRNWSLLSDSAVFICFIGLLWVQIIIHIIHNILFTFKSVQLYHANFN